jgi:ATP-dependent helicase/DNAse subunit B
MLDILKIKNPKEKKQIFSKTFTKSSDLQNITWVVSDLTSKLAFQKELFKQQALVPDESLLRAEELWLKFIRRLRGDYKIVSNDASQLILRKFLKNLEEPWMQRPGVTNLALQYMKTLMPILSHDSNFEVMGDFFQKNPETFLKWGHWYTLCHKIYQHFLKEKMILKEWVSSILINEVDFKNIWNRKIIFDLGAQLLPIEAELIQHLAKYLDVTVIVPEPSFAGDYAKALKSYELLENKKSQKTAEETTSEKVTAQKFSTNLAEIQDLCVQLRQWIEKDKISPEKIAVSAPDIGVYWPVLLEYLKVEGIPYQRSVQVPLKNFPEVSAWLSKLKIESGTIAYADLEQSLYSEESFPQRFDEFQSQFSNAYETQDIIPLKKYFALKKSDDELSLDKFFQWALAFWKESWSQEHLEFLIAKSFAEMPSKFHLRRSEWVELLEKISTREMTVDEGYANGVHCIDLISLKDLDVSHVHILGLTDKALRSTSSILVSERDIAQLKQHYGFLIAEPERTELEFEVRWNLENKQNTYVLSYPQTDFDGQQMSPSIVWLKKAFEQNGEKIPLATPRPSRWFQIQKEKASQNGEIDVNPRRWNLPERKFTLSASQIEDYLDCPFIMASKKLFNLNDLPDLDLDIDYQTRGKLLHKVAELLYKEHPGFHVTSEQLDKIFDKAQQECDFKVFDVNIWKAQKNRYKKMVQKFIEFEIQWRQKFSALATKYPETDFEIYLEDVLFRGRIDRIDVNENEDACVIIDYKFSMGDKGSHNLWLSKNELQLALYTYAIEQGALKNKYRVAGAIYYSFKELNRTRGMLHEEYKDQFFEFSSRSSAKITEPQKQKLLEDVKAKISETIARIKNNEFYPEPHDIKNCPQCHWRNLCRAPHLR